MKTRNIILGGILSLAMAFTSCTKDPINNLTVEESRIYITNFDSTVNFATLRTFSIADSVAVINNGRSTKELTTSDRAFINAARAQMAAAGFSEVSKTSKPNVGVNVSRIYNTSTGVIVYDNFYGGYGGFYDPFYWGPGFGGLNYFMPYGYATYSVREGALTVDLLNLKDAAASNRIKIVWTGLIRGSGIFSGDANQQVKMLFDQSPYLKNR